ncbi:thioredoxin domain-containing protein [Sphingomonas sp. ID1715]|uniref:thioredoxin domain-containing protein n=1 Tax=Sphingomonas sp. ID1715 TaxID=1656898 RepID=UPI00148A0B0D|nr:thioredoxin domain-containing protein [Sphingomonas sp. ID1715]NNM77046.1 thioredoxin domain-containing protein [Sphingomonas sp. ID1715]
MTKAHLLALGAAALALAGCNKGADNATAPANGSAAAGTVAPPAGQEWTQVVSQTADGGFVMGNPNAPVKLVEYLSLTCPHCKEFAETGYAKLQDYVKKGTLSLEVRNYVRDPIDMTATLVSRCNGPATYFAMTEQAFEQQSEIMTKIQGLPQAELQRLQGLQPAEQFKSLAAMLGIDQFAKQRGVPQSKLDQCFADKAALDQLVAMQKTANEMPGFVGTPTFILNGKMLENTGTWDKLEPQLKAAGA